MEHRPEWYLKQKYGQLPIYIPIQKKYKILIKDTQMVLGTHTILVQHWLQAIFSCIQIRERELLSTSVASHKNIVFSQFDTEMSFKNSELVSSRQFEMNWQHTYRESSFLGWINERQYARIRQFLAPYKCFVKLLPFSDEGRQELPIWIEDKVLLLNL